MAYECVTRHGAVNKFSGSIGLIHVSVRQNRSGWCESAISDKAIESALLSMDLIFSVHTVNGADGPGLSSISPESSTRAITRGLLKRERQQAWKRPRLVIIDRGTMLSRVNCCDAVWKWWDGADTWLGGLTTVDRNAIGEGISKKETRFLGRTWRRGYRITN